MVRLSCIATGILVASVSFNSVAQVTLSVDRDIEVLVTNGSEFEKPMIGHADKVVLPDGENQLLVRVAKIIRRDGKKEKFNSHPQVVRFNAENQELDLKLPKPVGTGIEADEYNKKPQLSLTLNDGLPYDFKSDVIQTSGLSLFRDYEDLVYKYNRRGDGEAVLTKSSNNSFKIDSFPENTLSSDEQIKKLFNEMPADKQKDFISWAVQQLAQ